MNSATYLRLGRSLKWIVPAAILWSVVLLFVARTTHRFHQHQRQAFASELEMATAELHEDLNQVRQENSRLRQELDHVGELSGAVARLQKEVAANETALLAQWNSHSNLLQASIEETRREIAEITQWGSEWHKSKTREAAQARLAERAQESSGAADVDYTKTKQMLSNIAVARKRLSQIRKEWQQLDKSEKEKFRSRLQEAQDEWWAAQQALGKDSVLYEDFPVRSETEDPSSSLLMRSILPDQNGLIVSVFLDGTVTFSKAVETN